MTGDPLLRLFAAIGLLTVCAAGALLVGCFFAWVESLPARRRRSAADELRRSGADLPLGPLERTHNLHGRLLKELATEGAENIQRESNQ